MMVHARGQRHRGVGGSCPDGMGVAQGEVVPFLKNLSRISATCETFELLSLLSDASGFII